MGVLIDSHCHLDDDRFLGDEEKVLLNAREHGVEFLITIGTDEKTSAAAAQIASRFPQRVYHTVGAHPSDADRFGEWELTEIERLARETRPKAIGEIGLDYYHASDRKKQVVVFERMILLARNLSLPLVIHDREAHEDIYRILNEQAKGLKILMHCYSAGAENVGRFMDLGCLFSIAGPITFKNGQANREAASQIPLDRLVVETDSPYLTPHPFRGQRNEPAFVKWTAEKVAEVKGVSFEDLAQATTRNAKAFFNI